MIAACWAGTAAAAPLAIDTAKSTVTVEVKKAGVFSAFGHDHKIAAPPSAGTVDTAAHAVELRFRAAALEVHDRGVSDKDRNEIQNTMLGPDVLDAKRYPEIVFRSTQVETAGAGAWKVQGDLTLHGQTRPVIAEVREDSGRYVGSVRFRQTEFGITPVKVAGGTVRVKDEIQIDFEIQPAR
ncbi:MAG TPA: YceI family protein [Bryobacteraceae bacterium]|nr:YceI family protein [Bryobacteraceae bacterium]